MTAVAEKEPGTAPPATNPESRSDGNPDAMVALNPLGKGVFFHLEHLVQQARNEVTRYAHSGREDTGDYGLLQQLDALRSTEPEPAAQRRLSELEGRIRGYCSQYNPDQPKTNDGQILLHTTRDNMQAFLTLTPARGSGSMPTMNTIRSVLNQYKIKQGVDFDLVGDLVEIVRAGPDIVWQAKIAQGKPPAKRAEARLDIFVPSIDKEEIASKLGKLPELLFPLCSPVEAGQAIGSFTNINRDELGIDVFGRFVAPSPRNLGFRISEDISITADGELIADCQGHVITDGSRIELEPVYTLYDPEPGSIQKLSFPGAVIIKGNIKGPGSISCDDLFLAGNSDEMDIHARNDVFVSGGIVGHRKNTVETDGRVLASFISEAKVSAMAEVVCLNAIINSQVLSNHSIRVLSEKGMIAGGKLQALREISAPTIGSEFGMLTETIVGKDFLSSARLDKIDRTISKHEENLLKIRNLKAKLNKRNISVENMPPDKQEIYLGILRKEDRSEKDMKSLMRRKRTLESNLQEFLAGSVQIAKTLYPPVKVQICEAVQEIRDRLTSVILRFDEINRTITSEAPPQTAQDTEKETPTEQPEAHQ